MARDPRSKAALIIAVVGLACGFALVGVEFLNIKPETPHDAVFGMFTTTGVQWAERAFIVLFGAVHILVAAIITVYRRTAT